MGIINLPALVGADGRRLEITVPHYRWAREGEQHYSCAAIPCGWVWLAVRWWQNLIGLATDVWRAGLMTSFKSNVSAKTPFSVLFRRLLPGRRRGAIGVTLGFPALVRDLSTPSSFTSRIYLNRFCPSLSPGIPSFLYCFYPRRRFIGTAGAPALSAEKATGRWGCQVGGSKNSRSARWRQVMISQSCAIRWCSGAKSAVSGSKEHKNENRFYGRGWS